MNVDQAAAQLRVSRRTIYYWMALGRLRFTAGPHRSRQLHGDDVRRVVDEHAQRRLKRTKGNAS